MSTDDIQFLLTLKFTDVQLAKAIVMALDNKPNQAREIIDGVERIIEDKLSYVNEALKEQRKSVEDLFNEHSANLKSQPHKP